MHALPERVDAIEDIVHAPCGDGAASGPSYESSTSTSSSSETCESAAEADLPDSDAVHAPDEVIEWPSHIDGRRLLQEYRRGSYHRLILKCAHHDDCFKKRNTSLRMRANLGTWEPVGYLCA